MQVLRFVRGGELVEIRFPDAGEPILPGVLWGRTDELFTSAFWAGVAGMHEFTDTVSHRIGNTLIEETVACLLGGYGIRAELGLAAFAMVQESGLLSAPTIAETDILEVLLQPLSVGSGQPRYRFPHQKSRYVFEAIRLMRSVEPPVHSGRALREWLRQIPGIGWKTGSWVARNWLDADDVAILDIHVVRACRLAGVFDGEENVSRDYQLMEKRFIEWAAKLRIRPSLLDSLIWQEMRNANRLATSLDKHQ